MSLVDAPEPVRRTLLMTDLVDSTRRIEELGDRRAADLGARHDALARSLLVDHGGAEIDKTDGFLFLFDDASAATRYVLSYHERLDTLGAELGVELRARAAVHDGEVILRRNPAEHVARGAKPIEVEGIAKPTTARLLGLAVGRQTLYTRAAFDAARQSSGSDAGLAWLAHGPYLFKGLEHPIEVFEAGRPGYAPLARPPDSEKARRVLPPEEEELLGWRPASGLLVPGRRAFRLVEKVGEGGFGEVWLARQEGGGELRVFKFCFDAERLRGLKREVTLFRLLRDTLGDRTDIARILDWNLDQPPFFIESEYTAGGSLSSWVAARGGFGQVPLPVRLELVAEVATALAAAHSVGVLHKDIKSDNVLVRTAVGDAPRAVLTDFGIGLLTDTGLLDRRGITSLGLTASEFSSGSGAAGAGTPLFLAPELLEGRAPTIQADIYALGVLLYQVCCGDLGRALGVGWERDVPEPELRDDIAACVERDPARRLGGAAELAGRLRAHDQRRDERLRLAERDRRDRRRRVWLQAGAGLGAVALVVAVVAVSLWRTSERHRVDAEHQRARADRARGDAEALLDVVTGDLYEHLQPTGQVSALDPVTRRTLAYYDALQAEDRSPDSELHRAAAFRHRGAVLQALGDVDGAAAALQQGRRLADGGRQAHPTEASWRREYARTLTGSASTSRRRGELAAAQASAEEAVTLLEALTAATPDDPALSGNLVDALQERGKVREAQGELDGALGDYERIVALLDPSAAVAAHDPAATGALSAAWIDIGDVHAAADRASKALDAYREALRHAEALVEHRGETAFALSHVSAALSGTGSALEALGRTAEAKDAYRRDLALSERLVALDPNNTIWQDNLGTTWNTLGSVLQGEGDLEGALDAYRKTLAIKQALAAKDPQNLEAQRNLGVTWGWVGSVCEELGRREEALAAYQAYDSTLGALYAHAPENAEWADSALVARRRLAAILLALGRPEDAGLVTAAGVRDFQGVATAHPDELRSSWGRFQLVVGNVAAATGAPEAARAAWTESADTLAAIPEPGAAVRRARAEALLRLGRVEDARPLIVQLLADGDADAPLRALARKSGLGG